MISQFARHLFWRGVLGNLCQAMPGSVRKAILSIRKATLSRRSSTVPTRDVKLTDELDRFVLARVESGRYENASEVVRARSAPWSARNSRTS